ncbi:N-acetyltransferase [Burkholderia sp. Tr-20390]|uniref:N-acetyltransferase n=1 Tax=Burkholderia sp. Tr-20390 TaxID=2703904 RepID=UPI00197E507D|nr:N-acetyltransferase [Burkholderia sp. Tr-20390]MBN3729409.1 N-acetyltransferase [Burkholderia sp. Tr-20390]
MQPLPSPISAPGHPIPIATEEVIIALAQLGEDPTVAHAESMRSRLDAATILEANDRAAAIRSAIRLASDESGATPPDAGSTLTFEANKGGDTPWKLDTPTDTIARLTGNDGRTLALVWCNRSDTCLQIEYAEVREDVRRCGVYRRLLERLSSQYNLYSDLAINNAAKNAYIALCALETRDGRMLLRMRHTASCDINSPEA